MILLKRATTIGVVLLLAILAGACARRIAPSPPMQPPPGVTARQVESAVRIAVSSAGDPASWSGGGYYWVVEANEPGKMIAGLRVKQYYLRVAITYSESSVTTVIIDSRNLHQSDDSIDRKGIIWQRRLNASVQRYLSELTPEGSAGN